MFRLVSCLVFGTLLKQTAAVTDSKQECGTFALLVTPPTLVNEVRFSMLDAELRADNTFVLQFFGRNIVFLVDRSGSMTGQPWSECVRALEAALAQYVHSRRALCGYV